MEQQQISAKKQKAMERVKRANAELAKVLRGLPEASCGQLLSAEGSQEGTLRFPSGAIAPTPMCTLRLAKL